MAYQFYNLHDRAEILIYGDINVFDNTSKDLANQIKELESQFDTIDIRINSDGGMVREGIAIYNALINSTATIRTYNDGVAASMASGILMAGDVIYAGSNTMIMIHRISGIALGNAQDLRSTADNLEKFENNSLIPMFAERTGKSTEKIQNEWMKGEDHWFSAQEAKDAGLIDEVIEPRANKVNVAKDNTKDIATAKAQFQNYLKPYLDQKSEQSILDKLRNIFQNYGTVLPTDSQTQNPDQMEALVNKLATLFNFQNVSTADADAVYTAVKNELTSLQQEKGQLEQSKQELENKLAEHQTNQIKELLDDAQNKGKITAQTRPQYENIAKTSEFEALKNIIDSLPAPKDLTATNKNGNGNEERTWEDLEKNNPNELSRLKNEAPEHYVELFKNKYGSIPKGFEAYAE